jgi:hypothetical protein
VDEKDPARTVFKLFDDNTGTSRICFRNLPSRGSTSAATRGKH